MLTIDLSFYSQLSDLLIEKFEDAAYHSEITTFEHNGYECEFRASLIIYHRIESFPEGDQVVIRDIVPIWWEFHTYTRDGEELLNDFDFDILKKHICQK